MSVEFQPLVNNDYFAKKHGGKTDKEIMQDVTKQLNSKPDVPTNKECAGRLDEKNELVDDYEWKMHKLQVAARNPKATDLAVDNKYHPDWYTNKTHTFHRLQGHVNYLKNAQKSGSKMKSGARPPLSEAKDALKTQSEKKQADFVSKNEVKLQQSAEGVRRQLGGALDQVAGGEISKVK